jgi:Kef-type K+ transport system membrane component KefB
VHHILPFALFVGTAMSVTAFPVLARILTDRNMHRTRIGSIAVASAGTDDVLAWSLLAVVVAIAGAGSQQARTGLSW